jgi:chromosomal replication initiation ATPase DnaA
MSPRVRRILEAVAKAHRVRVSDMLGPSRMRVHVVARREAMCELRKLSIGGTSNPFSYPAIGRIFNRHHTSVMAACGAIPVRVQKLSPTSVVPGDKVAAQSGICAKAGNILSMICSDEKAAA